MQTQAMYLKRPVIASNTGGPRETVLNGETGILCDDTPQAFAEQMVAVVRSPQMFKEMGEAGNRRVIDIFSFEAFAQELNTTLTSL